MLSVRKGPARNTEREGETKELLKTGRWIRKEARL